MGRWQQLEPALWRRHRLLLPLFPRGAAATLPLLVPLLLLGACSGGAGSGGWPGPVWTAAEPASASASAAAPDDGTDQHRRVGHGIDRAERLALREEVREMFYHGYEVSVILAMAHHAR
jgi:hypothetical protein